MATSDIPTRVVLDCSGQSLAATIPDLLEQAATAARAGDAVTTAELLALARERADAAALEPAAESIVPYDDARLAQHAIDLQAGAAAATAALAAAWNALREKRDAWLRQTDWMFVTLPSDTPAEVAKEINANQAAWASFRQALRDLTTTTTDPANPNWPTPPAAPAVTLS